MQTQIAPDFCLRPKHLVVVRHLARQRYIAVHDHRVRTLFGNLFTSHYRIRGFVCRVLAGSVNR